MQNPEIESLAASVPVRETAAFDDVLGHPYESDGDDTVRLPDRSGRDAEFDRDEPAGFRR